MGDSETREGSVPEVESEARQATTIDIQPPVWNAEVRKAWIERHRGTFGMIMNEVTHDVFRQREDE